MVDILLIQFLPKELHGFAKPLEVDNFPFAKELDHIVYIRIIGKPQNIVIGDPCLLLGSQVLRKICDGIAFDLHSRGSPGGAGGEGWIHPCGMIHKIGREGRILDLTVLQVPGQLVDNGAHHFQMRKLFGAY